MSSIDFNEYFWQKKSDTTQGWTVKYLIQACHKLYLSKANLSMSHWQSQSREYIVWVFLFLKSACLEIIFKTVYTLSTKGKGLC